MSQRCIFLSFALTALEIEEARSIIVALLCLTCCIISFKNFPFFCVIQLQGQPSASPFRSVRTRPSSPLSPFFLSREQSYTLPFQRRTSKSLRYSILIAFHPYPPSVSLVSPSGFWTSTMFSDRVRCIQSSRPACFTPVHPPAPTPDPLGLCVHLCREPHVYICCVPTTLST